MYKYLALFVMPVVVLCIFVSPWKANALYWLSNQTDNSINLTGDSSYSCVGNNDLSALTGAFDPTANLALFNGQQVNYPKDELAQENSQDKNSEVLSAYDAKGQEKWIEVNLEDQTLKAWEGDKVVLQFPISSGKWFPTPKGTYTIYVKYRYIKMKGGSMALGDYYDLPNVPDTMFFYQGYGIHGAYWHNNFGQPMSHGCVNEPLNEAHQLFEWAGPYISPDQSMVKATADNPGSRVVIQ